MKDEAIGKSQETMECAEKLQILYQRDCLSSKVLLNAVEMIEKEQSSIAIERIDIGQSPEKFPKIQHTPVCRIVRTGRVIAEHSGAMLPSQLRYWIRSLETAELG